MPLETAMEQPFNVARQVNKLIDQMQKGYYNFCPGQTWTPNVNLYEIDNAYLVCVDLAGVDKEKIDVEIADQTLTLKGARAVPSPEGPDDQAEQPHPPGHPHSRVIRVHLLEIDHGDFCRIVELPHNVAREKITATHRNGLLWIEIPKLTD